jgi:hypothetical protein
MNSNQSTTPALNPRLETEFSKSGAWFTHTATGAKVRGAAAAAELLAKQDAEAAEAEAAATAAAVEGRSAQKLVLSSVEEALGYADGTRFFFRGLVKTDTGRYFKTSQPATVFTCTDGTRRVMHLQDVPLARGRSLAQTLEDRRRAARERSKARRAEKNAAKSS